MKWSIIFNLIIALICWHTNAVESNPHHHDHQDHHDHNHGESKQLSQNKPLDFAIHLMDELHHEAAMDENIITSPISIITTLMATYRGAGGKTQEELGAYLGISSQDPETYISSTSAALKQILKKEVASFTESNLAAGLFVQKDFPVKPEFVADVKQIFPTNVANVDFSSNGVEATNSINTFVSDVTKGRIPKLFPSPLDSTTQVVLVSALYFHGVWLDSFSAVNTKPDKFYTGVKDVEVHMMNNVKSVPYYEDPRKKFQAVQIPYHNDYYMAIVLPYKEQSLMNLTHYLTGEDLNQALYHAQETGVDYKIPKMKFSWSKSLKSVLEKEGLHSMFERADFGKMTAAAPISVSDVVHAAEIQVDEEGTKASAATAVNFATYSLKWPPTNPKIFHANRPFMAIIYHRPTSLVLFAAFVHQP